MRIGVDFDNTIVCYDGIFHRAALDEGLIPQSLLQTKGAVRDHLRAVGREDAWTELQGHVYGARMDEAEPFPGALEFFQHMMKRGHTLFIISHKTRTPYLGPKYDLHQTARSWLEGRGIFGPRIGLPREHVFFDLTKEDKLQRIAATACTHFIDDLPEFLAEPGFPRKVEQVLFDPANAYAGNGHAHRVRSWQEIMDLMGA
jgi:hypothetical protein